MDSKAKKRYCMDAKEAKEISKNKKIEVAREEKELPEEILTLIKEAAEKGERKASYQLFTRTFNYVKLSRDDTSFPKEYKNNYKNYCKELRKKGYDVKLRRSEFTSKVEMISIVAFYMDIAW